ncbi:MAG: translation initiation factor IF-2 subunit beta [Thermofilaceae archaeon]
MEQCLEYNILLERAYKMIPSKSIVRERFEVEEPEVMVTGKRTFVLNFKKICDDMNREPEILLRYLLKELGASGNREEDVAVIYGVFSSKMIKELINLFLKSYVYCSVCGSPDTILRREERKLMQLKCMACGALTPVKPF